MFKRRKGNGPKTSNAAPVIHKFIDELNTQQHALARYVSAKFEKLSKQSKQISLLIFSLCFGTICVYILIEAIQNKSADLVIEQMSFPSHVLSKDIAQTKSVARRDIQNYKNIKRYRIYLDSLHSSISGRPIYDSIVNAMPGLLDSLHLLENNYLQKIKSK